MTCEKVKWYQKPCGKCGPCTENKMSEEREETPDKCKCRGVRCDYSGNPSCRYHPDLPGDSDHCRCGIPIPRPSVKEKPVEDGEELLNKLESYAENALSLDWNPTAKVLLEAALQIRLLEEEVVGLKSNLEITELGMKGNGMAFENAKTRAEKAEQDRDDLKTQLGGGGPLILANAAPSWDALSPEQHTDLNRIVADIKKPIQAQLARVREHIEATKSGINEMRIGGGAGQNHFIVQDHPAYDATIERLDELLSSIPKTGQVLVKAKRLEACENVLADTQMERSMAMAAFDDVFDENKSLQAENETLRKFVQCRNCNRWFVGFEAGDQCPWIKSSDPSQCGLSGIKAALEAGP